MPINPSLDRGFTLTNFKWHLRANGHLKGEKIGACNYLKLSRIPVDIRLFWNKTNDRNTAFSLDELVRGFKIDERDEAGNARTLNNVFLWSEGDIPQEPLSDLIELEYNGEGAMITPLLGNKSGAIDKIEKVSVVSTLDKVINPIKVVSITNTAGFTISDFYRINANVKLPTRKYATLYATKKEKYENDVLKLKNFSNVFTKNGEASYIGNLYETRSSVQCAPGKAVFNKNFLNKNLQNEQGIKVAFKKVDGYCYQQNYGNMSMSGILGIEDSFNNAYLYSKKGGWLAYNEKGYFCLYGAILLNEKVVDFEVALLGEKITLPTINFNRVVEKEDVFLIAPQSKTAIGIQEYETTYDEELTLYIFKTQDSTSYIAPKQDKKTYISLIAQSENTKKADFNFKLIEISKTSAASETPYLYMGGLSGIKIPVTNGFELAFNNKKSGLDYVVLEIPAGDIYKVELKLLNVYDNTAEGA